MILLNDWSFIVSTPLLYETLRCHGVPALYILPRVAVLVPTHFFTKAPQFVFRKLLHTATQIELLRQQRTIPRTHLAGNFSA